MIFLPSVLKDLGNRFAASSLCSRLRRGDGDPQSQKDCLQRILVDLSQSDYGKAHLLTEYTSPADFARLVPLQERSQAIPLINQLRSGAEHLLWPGATRLFSQTPVFPWDTPLQAPLSEAFSIQFKKAWKNLLLIMIEKGAEAGLLRSSRLCIGTPSLASPLLNGIPGILSTLFDGENKPFFYSLADLEQNGGLSACLKRDAKIRLIAIGDPLWLASLTAEPLPQDRTFWVLSHSPCLANMKLQVRRILGQRTELLEAFACDTGIFAVRDDAEQAGMRLLVDAGVYYEFIPLTEYLKTPLASLGKSAKPVGEVLTGQEYVMFITNTSGLCRHNTGEVVCFVGTDPHRIEACGKADHLLRLQDLILTERKVSEALTICCDKHDWTIVHFHVAPANDSRPGATRNAALEWWIELRPGSHHTPTGPTLSQGLDEELSRLDPGYATLRRQAKLEAPIVRLVIPGVFNRFLQDSGRADGFCRLPRCLPDRRMADSLAQLTRFSD